MMMTMDIDADQQNDATVTMADVQQEANSMAAQQQQALAPNFPPLQQDQHNGTMVKQEMRRIKVPRHRMSPLRDSWENIMRPIVEHMRLLIRMNTKTKCIEMKSSPHTTDPDALQKAADFYKISSNAHGFFSEYVYDLQIMQRFDESDAKIAKFQRN